MDKEKVQMIYLYSFILITLIFFIFINKIRYKNQTIYYKKEINKYKKMAWDKKINNIDFDNNIKKINSRIMDFENGKLKLVQDILDTDFTLNPNENKNLIIDAISNIEFYGKDNEN